MGKLYEYLKFNPSHISKPNYFWIINKERKHRFNFRKNVLKDKLEEFDDTLTGLQNMYNNGFNRIFDCGNYVFEKIY